MIGSEKRKDVKEFIESYRKMGKVNGFDVFSQQWRYKKLPTMLIKPPDKTRSIIQIFWRDNGEMRCFWIPRDDVLRLQVTDTNEYKEEYVDWNKNVWYIKEPDFLPFEIMTER